MENQFAENLKLFRKENEMSQTELAKKLGVSQATICFWENGTNEPTLSYLVAISNLFGVSIDDLVGNSISNNQIKPTNGLVQKFRKLSDENKKLVSAIIDNLKK